MLVLYTPPSSITELLQNLFVAFMLLSSRFPFRRLCLHTSLKDSLLILLMEFL